MCKDKTKVCPKCGKVKPLSEFARGTIEPIYCKQCHNEYLEKHHKEDYEESTDDNLEYDALCGYFGGR